MAEGTRTSSGSSNTRRLPSWMVGPPAAASSAKVTNNETLDGEANIKTEEKKGRKKPDEPKGKPILTRKSKAVQETKEKATAGDGFDEGDKNKQRNKRRKKPKAKRHDHEDEDEDGGGIEEEEEEEEELTVEDLVNIAAGYMKAADNELNAKRKRKPVLNQESQHETQLPVTIRRASGNDLVEGSFGNEPGLSPVADAAASCGSTASLSSGQNCIVVGSTGDPAQDMLDLFLGPLLRKPPPPLEEKKTEFVTENIDLAHELKKQSQNGIGEEMPPLKKKKSSLREAVSLLLD